jgi:CRISPR-associated protein (TIGR03986 family)
MTAEQNTQNQVSAIEEPKTKERKGPYRFLNPYNFVRYLERERPADNELHILDKCPPPPHDRYVGLTGRITCRVEAKTLLFISDTHATQELKDKEREGHRIYRFFEYEGEPALPASSLRGMIRSVFEAATNSCFAVFDGGRFDLREGKLPDNLVPARVVKIDQTGAKLEILDCSEGYPEQIRLYRRKGKVIPLMNAGSVSTYEERVLDTRTDPPTPFNLARSLVPKGVKDGDRVAALIALQPVNNGLYQYFSVKKLVPIDQHEKIYDGRGYRKVFGYVHLTGPNIERKHLERLFFRWDDSQSKKVSWDEIPEGWRLEVTEKTVEEYNQHLRAYWERNGRQVSKLDKEGQPWRVTASSLPHPSYFIREGRSLREGDLVYYLPFSKIGIPLLRPVLISRLPYRYSRHNLMSGSNHLSRCHEPSTLCPACRIFGWISGEEKQAPSKQTAYAGRVRFSHGKPVTGTIQTFEDPIPLAILSSPKPTTTNFYLVNGDGRPDGKGGPSYDDKQARLRGRKVYRHHGRMLSEQEYVRAGEKKEDDQNRTVKGVLKSGAFTFTVEFENLAKEELGALLWALELEGWHHRLGFAKPLGFGSVVINVEKLEVCDPDERYAALDNDGWRIIEKGVWREQCVNLFKTRMRELYGKEFLEL